MLCSYNASHYWSGGYYYGMSVPAAAKLGARFGYTMVYCESHGVNCVFVDDTVIASCVAHLPTAEQRVEAVRGLRKDLTAAKLYRPPKYHGVETQPRGSLNESLEEVMQRPGWVVVP